MLACFFFLNFVHSVVSVASTAEQKAEIKTRQFFSAMDKLGSAQGSDPKDVQSEIEIVKNTFQDLLTVATSDLKNRPKLYNPQRWAKQIMNFLLMVVFVEEPETAEKLIVSLVENKTDPETAKQLVEAFGSNKARENIHAMLNSQALASDRDSKFNKEQREALEERVRDFYTDWYKLTPEDMKAAQSYFNRNVAIAALALTFAGVVASIVLGATIIGLPAALGLLVSTVGGPGSMAVQAWNKHKTEQLIGKAAPDMSSSFQAILVTIEQLKAQIENLQKQTKTSCPNPISPVPPTGPVSRVKQFFGLAKK